MAEFTAFGHEHLEHEKIRLPGLGAFELAESHRIVLPQYSPDSFVLSRVLHEVKLAKPQLVGLEGIPPNYANTRSAIRGPISRYLRKRHWWYASHGLENGINSVYLEESSSARTLYHLSSFLPNPDNLDFRGNRKTLADSISGYLSEKRKLLLQVSPSREDAAAIGAAFATAENLMARILETSHDYNSFKRILFGPMKSWASCAPLR